MTIESICHSDNKVSENNRFNWILENITQIIEHKSENETGGARHKIIVDIIADKIHRNRKKGSILEFKVDPYKESIELVKFLGQGSFGEVWKGKEKSSGREVAVKLEKPTWDVSFSYEFFLFSLPNNDKNMNILESWHCQAWIWSLHGSSWRNWNSKNNSFWFRNHPYSIL